MMITIVVTPSDNVVDHVKKDDINKIICQVDDNEKIC